MFADWWEPFTFGVGPAGDYVAHLDDAQRGALRARCAEVLPPAPFELSASAWYMQARAWSPGSGRPLIWSGHRRDRTAAWAADAQARGDASWRSSLTAMRWARISRFPPVHLHAHAV